MQAADAYVRPFILRGVPSLFRDLRPLYADPAKAAALQQLFEGYQAALEAGQGLPPLAGQAQQNGSSSASGQGGMLSAMRAVAAVASALQGQCPAGMTQPAAPHHWPAMPP